MSSEMFFQAESVFGLRFSSLTVMKQNLTWASTVKARGGQVSKLVEVHGLEIYCSTVQGNLELVSIGNDGDSRFGADLGLQGDKSIYLLAPVDASVSVLLPIYFNTIKQSMHSRKEQSCTVDDAVKGLTNNTGLVPARVNRSGNLGNDAPQYSINFELAGLAMSLDEVQLQQVLTLYDYLCTCRLREKLDDLEVDSRLVVLDGKVDVFAEELDDLIKERVTHFTKGEVQRRKDLEGQVAELQEELAACKRELTRATRQGCIAVQLRIKKMPEPKSYDRTGEARQMDDFFWHLERYFEALDIDYEEEKVQTAIMYLTDTTALWWMHRYTDGREVKTWEKFQRELKRQFYPKSVKDMAMINLRRLRQKGSVREYVKEYSALMLKIPEMSERQRLCFFVDGLEQWVATELQQWVATELRQREPHDLASAMAIAQRLEDFKQGEKLRFPRRAVFSSVSICLSMAVDLPLGKENLWTKISSGSLVVRVRVADLLYGRYRPPWSPLSKRLKGWQTMWWHYAQHSVLSDVRKSLRKTSWKYLGERL
ncbi:hypothetical protein RJ639_034372 [Escallonia herrerae]|uniref:Retrotransposon gag domain-containing protein n=1 Tax=Escallonia herrerae TaxID=1293975 RepID=A0AA88WTH8_9ASTE|nr:hypothetical protein RJ639_034372 [Escallonia herrerae]